MDNENVLTDVPLAQEHISEVPTAEVVKHVYESVWNEYSSWSQQYNQKALQGLWRLQSGHRLLPFEKRPRIANATASSSTSSHTCTISDFVDDNGIEQSSIALQPIVIDTEKFPLYPPYLSCTPISQNLLVGDDSHYMPFIPFSDDPTYDYSIDLQLHHYTAWQRPTLGLDEQHIVLETLRRLVNEHGPSYDTIDDTRVLPMQCYDIVKLLRKRDFPKWLPLPLDLPQYTVSDKPSAAVNYFLEYFCSNLNCMMGFCSLHDGNLVAQQVLESIPPKTPYTKPSDMVDAPCGADCFLQPPSNLNSIGTTWTEDDYDALATTLRYAPDTAPCDLAIICRKPCREVHRYQSTRPRVIPRAHKSKVLYPSKARSYGYDDEKPNRFTPTASAIVIKDTVTHDADVLKAVLGDGKDAPAHDQEKFAEQRNVHVIEPTLNAIPKYACRVVQDDTNSLCKNVGIQKGTFKTTQVRESQWGLGLFLAETAEEGELVSEYVGESIRPETVDCRNFHADHRERSYVFHLNPTYALDSAYAGNETRYMNHSAEAPNCHTRVVLVNGEHRIGIYAARHIEKGEELLINYGSNFWKSDKLEELETSLPLPPTYDDPKDLTYMNLDSH